MSSVLGVATLDYLPYCFTNWLNPFVALAMTWLGLGIIWRNEEQATGEVFIPDTAAIAE